MKKNILDFLRDEEGLTTVEYAIAGSLVAAGVVTAFTDLGTGVKTAIEELVSGVGGTNT